jgi:hypothetical protein
MAFNSLSYHRNKWRRDAIARLCEARRLKRDGGDAWRLESAVKLARSSWRLYLIQCRLIELSGRRAAPFKPEPFSTRESINA